MTAPLDVSNRDFLIGLFGDEWGSAYVTAFAADPSEVDRGGWAGNTAERILRTFGSHENQYYTVSLFHTDYADQARGKATRRKAMFDRMFLVLVDDVAEDDDLGDGRKVRASLVREKWGEPSFRLETSPRNEQWGYLFDNPLADRHEAETLVREMIARGLTSDGADPGMSGVTRLVRLPGGTNKKRKHGFNGFKCRLNTWHPDRRFSPYELAERWGFDLAAAAALLREPEERMAAPEREAPGEWQEAWGNLLPITNHEHAPDFKIDDLAWSGHHGSPDEDPLFLGLRKLGLVKERRGGGQFEITCPFVNDHTGGLKHGNTGTARMPNGGISCHHGHCQGLVRRDFALEVARRLKPSKDPETVALVRRLMPWTPEAYNPRELRAPNAVLLEIQTRLEKQLPSAGADTRSMLARAALALAPYVAEGRLPEALMQNEITTTLTTLGTPLSAWTSAWAWARSVTVSKDQRHAR